MSIRGWSEEITFPPHCLNPPSNYQWNWVRRRRYQRQSGTLCGVCRLLTIWRIYVEFSLDRKTSLHLPLPQAHYFQPQQFSNSYPPYFQTRPFSAGYTNPSCFLSFQSIMSNSCPETSLQFLSTFSQPSSIFTPFWFSFFKTIPPHKAS